MRDAMKQKMNNYLSRIPAAAFSPSDRTHAMYIPHETTISQMDAEWLRKNRCHKAQSDHAACTACPARGWVRYKILYEGLRLMRNIAMLSYGKDSLAQLEVMHRHGIPISDIVTADIMATPDIPAYLPELADFRKRIDREILERYGVPVTHVRAEKSFVELFYRQLTSRSKYTGTYGWPPVFGHWCMKWLKREPIKKYFEGVECVEWVGIAADETARHGQLNKQKRSALVEYGVTEAEAMRICEELGWVSPTYLHSGRDGCWFCPCQGIDQLRRLHNEFPEYWQMMLNWDKDTEKRFQIDHTLKDFDWRFRMENAGLVPKDRTFRWKMLEPYTQVEGKNKQKKAQMLIWYNKLHTDSAEYKMLGNGIALPPALYCIQGMADVMNREGRNT